MKRKLDYLFDTCRKASIQEIKRLAKKIGLVAVELDFVEGNTNYTGISFVKGEDSEIEDIYVLYQHLDDDGLYYTTEENIDECSLSVLQKIVYELREIA